MIHRSSCRCHGKHVPGNSLHESTHLCLCPLQLIHPHFDGITPYFHILIRNLTLILQYTYYTLSALHVRVPNALKRSLTTLQISQFIIGGSYAASYLFIKYIPPLNLQKKVDEIVNIRQEFVTCLSSSAEVWAVLANVVYLMPLTYVSYVFFLFSRFMQNFELYANDHVCFRYLFVMFFIRSYLNVGGKPTKAMKKAVPVEKPVMGKTVAA